MNDSMPIALSAALPNVPEDVRPLIPARIRRDIARREYLRKVREEPTPLSEFYVVGWRDVNGQTVIHLRHSTGRGRKKLRFGLNDNPVAFLNKHGIGDDA